MVRIAGLWKKESEKGLILKGKLLDDKQLSKGHKLVIIPNSHKFGDNDPDYLLYLDNTTL